MNYIDDWVILAQSHQLAVRHRDVVLAHMKELGLRLIAKKSVLSPLQRTTFLGVAWDSTSMQAHLSPVRIESILSSVKSIRLGQSFTVKQFQILEGCSSQGLWKDHHLLWHINYLEILAVFLALKNFLADLRGHHILIHSDNTSVVSYINHQGGLWSRPLANWHAKSPCGPKESRCLCEQLTSRGSKI